MASSLEKFQDLLRELFQFDCADLDFGIYRIMNHKRDVIERLIVEKLPNAVAEELRKGAAAEQAQSEKKLQETRQQIGKSFGHAAIDADGRLAEMFHDTPLGKCYLELMTKSAEGQGRDALEAAIFNHLYTFFSRYYQDGDFISKRRYSKRHRYAIPYNGEEVHLHWANNDQYYVKTGEHFHNYAFKSRRITVEFGLKAADVEQDNIKSDKRFFVPYNEAPSWDEESRRLAISFEYRPLTSQEKITYGKTKQQENIINKAVSEIPVRMNHFSEAAAALMAERRKSSDGKSVSFFEHHLRQYTRRNTSDFFIHKDLKGFLTRELDFYLKNEVLSLDEMEASGEERSETWFQTMRAIRSVGGQIVDFLHQIEYFQMQLWEKRKFIIETQYCITINQIDITFYEEIALCDAQWDEWRELSVIDEDQANLFNADRDKTTARVAFLKTHPTLVLDTRHFDQNFVDRLLGSIDDLDGMTDGVLIHSENWQALSLIQTRFRGMINTIYIDPPYNTGDSEILYKNEYLLSSWLTLMENRLTLSMRFLEDDPVIFVAIDDFELADLSQLIDKYFTSLRREMIIVNHHPQGGKATTLATTHEYMLCCVGRTSNRVLFGRTSNAEVERRPFKRSGTAESNFRYGRPNSFYAILVEPDTKEVVGIEAPPEGNSTDYPTGRTHEGYVRVYPTGANGDERVWRRSYESCVPLVEKGALVCSENLTIYHLIEHKDRIAALFSNWVDSRYNAGTFGANLLSDIIGRHNSFSYPKSLHTVGDAIFAVGMGDNKYCMDYFAGSGTTGHAVINLNREDGRRRKFILVEMGDYFDTVLLPRIKKITFAPQWKDGKPRKTAAPEDLERGPRIVKYSRLESYEDALNNIDFDGGSEQQLFQFDDYLLNYMLQWETRHSETLLNVEKLSKPFSYQLNIHADGEKRQNIANIPETFNYLIGLDVQTRRVHYDDDRRYLVYRGQVDQRRVAVIWRETEDWQKPDFERDRDFVAEQKLIECVDDIYVNGDSFIHGAKALEPLFKRRMFAGVAE